MADVHLRRPHQPLLPYCDLVPGPDPEMTGSALGITCRRCLERVICTSCKLRIGPCRQGPGHSIPAVGAGTCQGWLHHFNSLHNCGGSPMNVARPWPGDETAANHA